MITSDPHAGRTVPAVGGPAPREAGGAALPATVPGTVYSDDPDAFTVPGEAR
jgi:hypothetical protein